MPNKKIDKQNIVNACIELLRSGKPLSARNIAKILGCSTQPIYYLYKNMQDLEPDITKQCKNIYDNYVLKYTKQKNIMEYKSYGLAFIDFAKNEKGLFKYIYLEKHCSKENNLFHNLLENDVHNSVSKLFNISLEKAKHFHINMGIFTFGLAMMQYFDSNLSEKEISNALSQEFNALVKENKGE